MKLCIWHTDLRKPSKTGFRLTASQSLFVQRLWFPALRRSPTPGEGVTLTAKAMARVSPSSGEASPRERHPTTMSLLMASASS